MSDETIGQLADGTSPADADLFIIERPGSPNDNFSLLWSAIKAAVKVYTDTLYPSGSGTSTGTNTGDQTSVSGNAGTATALQTGRMIDGVTFDGTANITVIAPATHAATSKTTPVDADELPLADSAASFGLKKLTWANLKATAKTYFDTLYQPLDSDLTSIAALSTTSYGRALLTLANAAAADFPVKASNLSDLGSAATARVNLGVASSDGWVDDTANTWTYVSATSFKRSGVDETIKFKSGTFLRLKQGGSYLYFVVASSTFSTDTTVTITGGTDYTLANAAITDNYYSYEANPQGYPAWFNYTTNATGFSSKSSDVGQFSVNGRTVTVIPNILGTSNATTFTCDAPITAAANSGMVCLVTNSGTTVLGRAFTTSGTITFGLSSGSSPTTMPAGGFTNSGSKGCGSNVCAIYRI